MQVVGITQLSRLLPDRQFSVHFPPFLLFLPFSPLQPFFSVSYGPVTPAASPGGLLTFIWGENGGGGPSSFAPSCKAVSVGSLPHSVCVHTPQIYATFAAHALQQIRGGRWAGNYRARRYYFCLVEFFEFKAYGLGFSV